MAIRYLPRDVLDKMAPRKKIERLLSGDLTVKKAALSFLDGADFISKRDIRDVALKVAKGYRQKFGELKRAGLAARAAKNEAVNEKKLLVSRVENAIVSQIADGIREEYDSEFYTWLPSDAETPDPIHQLNYGKRFQIGDGEMPGDRPGCRCGMEIHVKGSKLEL